MKWTILWLLCLSLFCRQSVAQTVTLVPSTAPRGGSGTMVVTLTSPAKTQPVVLQWTMVLGNDIGSSAKDIKTGDAAAKAGKELTCAPVAGAAKETYKCVIVGGSKAIANGTIFLVKYKVKETRTPHITTIQIFDAIAGVEKNPNQLHKIDIPPSLGTITIR